MGTTHQWAVDYNDLLYLLQEEDDGDEEGTVAPPLPEPPEEPRTRWRRRIPAWASAIRGFSNAVGLAIFVLLAVPMAARCTNADEVGFSVFFFVMSIVFPVLGYVHTWDLPEET